MFQSLMTTDGKAHLAQKLLQLLSESGKTQVELSEFAGISQGLVANHISRRAFPKTVTLFKYAEFFSKHLRRPIDLYELTGIEELKGITTTPPVPDPEAQALWDIYMSLPDGASMKELLKQKIRERKARNESGE